MIPTPYTFNATDNGRHEFTGVSLHTTGLQKVTLQSGSISGDSNYVQVSGQPVTQKIYFGDIHGHTYFTDGAQSAAQLLGRHADQDSIY